MEPTCANYVRLKLAELLGAVRSGPTSAVERHVYGALCACVQIFISGGGPRLVGAVSAV